MPLFSFKLSGEVSTNVDKGKSSGKLKRSNKALSYQTANVATFGKTKVQGLSKLPLTLFIPAVLF